MSPQHKQAINHCCNPLTPPPPTCGAVLSYDRNLEAKFIRQTEDVEVSNALPPGLLGLQHPASTPLPSITNNACNPVKLQPANSTVWFNACRLSRWRWTAWRRSACVRLTTLLPVRSTAECAQLRPEQPDITGLMPKKIVC